MINSIAVLENCHSCPTLNTDGFENQTIYQKPKNILEYKPQSPIITILNASTINISYPKHYGSTLYIIDEMVNLYPYQCCCRSDESFYVHNLKPNTIYTFRLTVCYGDKRSQPSDWSEIYFESSIPNPPGNLKCAINFENIEISWKKPENHRSNYIHYELEVDEENDLDFRLCYVGYSTSYSYSIKNIISNIIYFRVRACNMVGWSDYSPTSCFVINENCNLDNLVVEAPKLISSTQNSLTFCWRDSFKFTTLIELISIESYELHLMDDDIQKSVYQGNDTNYTFGNLNPATLYKLRLTINLKVRSKTSSITSKTSSISYASTLAQVPGPVSNFQYKNLEFFNSFEFFWDPPYNSIATDVITYFFKLINCYTCSSRIFEGIDNHVIITNLDSYVTYDAQVSCIAINGFGEWSKKITFKTDYLVPCISGPPELKILDPDFNERARDITIIWESPYFQCDSLNLFYELQIYDHSSNRKSWTVIYNGSNRSFSIDKLCPSTQFSLRVRCFNGFTFGDFSEISSFKTLPSYPSQPQAITFNLLSSNYVNISWKLSTYDGGSPINNLLLFIQKINVSHNTVFLEYHSLSSKVDNFILNMDSIDWIKLNLKAVNSFGSSTNDTFKTFSNTGIKYTLDLPNIYFNSVTNLLSIKWSADFTLLGICGIIMFINYSDRTTTVDLWKKRKNCLIEHYLSLETIKKMPKSIQFNYSYNISSLNETKIRNIIQSFSVHSVYSNMIQLTWKVNYYNGNLFQIRYKTENKSRYERFLYNPPTSTDHRIFLYPLKNLVPNCLYEIELLVKISGKSKPKKCSWFAFEQKLSIKTLPFDDPTIIDISARFLDDIHSDCILIEWITNNVNSKIKFSLQESHLHDNYVTQFTDIYNGSKCSYNFNIADIPSFHYRFRVSIDTINKTYVQCSLKNIAKRHSLENQTNFQSINYFSAIDSDSKFPYDFLRDLYKKYKYFLVIFFLFTTFLAYKLSFEE